MSETTGENNQDDKAKAADLERRRRFGEYLKEKRGKTIKQEALASGTGRTQSSISQLEKGKGKVPEVSEIPNFAAVLGRPIDEVLLAAGYAADALSEFIELRPGFKVRIVLREGEPGTHLDIDETMLAVLQTLWVESMRLKKGE